MTVSMELKFGQALRACSSENLLGFKIRAGCFSVSSHGRASAETLKLNGSLALQFASAHRANE